jgi:hypothetical protein
LLDTAIYGLHQLRENLQLNVSSNDEAGTKELCAVDKEGSYRVMVYLDAPFPIEMNDISVLLDEHTSEGQIYLVEADECVLDIVGRRHRERVCIKKSVDYITFDPHTRLVNFYLSERKIPRSLGYQYVQDARTMTPMDDRNV